MYCPNCGVQVPDGRTFCCSCGSPVVVPPSPPAETPPAPAASGAPVAPPRPGGIRKRSSTGLIVAVLLVALVLLLVATYLLLRALAPAVLGRIPVVSQWQPCYIQASQYLEQIEGVASEWDEANALASTTPRLSLAQPLAVLQDVRRRADGLARLECAGRAHTLLIHYMDAQIGSYTALMAQEPDVTVQAKFERAQNIRALWAGEMARMASGEPPYDGSARVTLPPVSEPPEPTALPTLTPTPALIATPAYDMNLRAGDVGVGYVLSDEDSLLGFASGRGMPSIDEASGGNYRMFENEDGGVVLCWLITLKRMPTAADLNELILGFEEGFAGRLAGTRLEELAPPAIGDEAFLRTASFPDVGVSLYALAFRKANVIGMLVVLGTADSASEAIVDDLALKLDRKVR